MLGSGLARVGAGFLEGGEGAVIVVAVVEVLAAVVRVHPDAVFQHGVVEIAAAGLGLGGIFADQVGIDGDGEGGAERGGHGRGFRALQALWGL
ncbi:hypothetical protein WJ970_32760 [Achromobacter xylosoxidans]